MRSVVLDPSLWRILLTLLLGVACATDVRARRIPNALVLVVLGAALLRAVLAGVGTSATVMPGFATGPGAAAMGALCGLALWLPLYAVGAFGAGDVKLFAAAAAWLGPSAVPNATLYAALAGGVLGLAWFGAQRIARLAPMIAPRAHAALQPTTTGKSRVPYGVAIAAGVLGVVWGVR
ncbi:MAG TPA: prepilin peptidase [Gemmatirosa sp.]